MRRTFSIEEALDALEQHPRRIADAVRAIDRTRLSSDAMAGTWTATDVLAHLRACNDACRDVVPRILASERPTLQVVGPRALIETASYRELEVTRSLPVFTRQRAALLDVLRPLGRSDWSRAAIVVEGGGKRERSIRDYLMWLARHEQGHVEQFERFGRKLARVR